MRSDSRRFPCSGRAGGRGSRPIRDARARHRQALAKVKVFVFAQKDAWVHR